MTIKNIALVTLTMFTFLLSSCSKTEAKAPTGPAGVEPKKMADLDVKGGSYFYPPGKVSRFFLL